MSRERWLQLSTLTKASVVYFLVDRTRYQGLPSSLQGRASNADQELIAAIGMDLVAGTREAYAFTSQAKMLTGKEQLKQEKRHQRREVVPIQVLPLVFFESIERSRPQKLSVNFGLEDSFLIEASEIDLLVELFMVSRLAALPVMYVVQDRTRFALEMEFEGKKYAVGFLTKEDAVATMDGLKVTNPGCSLEGNVPGQLAENILHSEFEGIILNPAKRNQIILDRERLEKLLQLSSEEGNSDVGSVSTLGGLLSSLWSKVRFRLRFSRTCR